jgi:predicted Zn-dependent protease
MATSTDSPRIEELRHRLDVDPASVLFADLAEEYRRDGRFAEAVQTCRLGLARQPRFLSARVTLGRCLVELNDLECAQAELEIVRRLAPTNIGALQVLAEVYERRGLAIDALECHRAAVDLARMDPALQSTSSDLTRQLDAFNDRIASGQVAQQQEIRPETPLPNSNAAVIHALERFLRAVQNRQRQVMRKSA